MTSRVAAIAHKCKASFVLPLVLALWMAACADPATEPADDNANTVNNPTLDGGLEVSQSLVLAPASPNGTAPNAVSGAAEEVAWTSLRAATFANAQSATVTNLRTLESRSVNIVNGGFDPVPLLAFEGDTIGVEVVGYDGKTVKTRRVTKRKPPTIVRTNPPRGRTDVPINSLMNVVFSEPVAQVSVTEFTVLLEASGGGYVPATVRLIPGREFEVELTPAAPLQRGRGYTLHIDASVADLQGATLGTRYITSFVTEPEPQPVRQWILGEWLGEELVSNVGWFSIHTANDINSIGVIVGEGARGADYWETSYLFRQNTVEPRFYQYYTATNGLAINEYEVVAGYRDHVATSWTPGSFFPTELPSLSSRANSAARAINSHGIVAGFSTAADGTRHAVQWLQGFGRPIDDLVGMPGMSAEAVAINNSGVIAGILKAGSDTAAPVAGSFIFTADRRMVELDYVMGAVPRVASINSQGVMVGSFGEPSQAFLLPGIGQPPVILGMGVATDISDRGRVVGAKGPPAQELAYTWFNGEEVQLPGPYKAKALAVNTCGVVVGYAYDVSSYIGIHTAVNFRPMRWTRGRMVGQAWVPSCD